MIDQRNVDRLYKLIIEDAEWLCGSHWEDLIACEYDTPKSIINEFINIFINNTFREFDDDKDAFVPIANREERRAALVKFFEKVAEDLKKEN